MRSIVHLCTILLALLTPPIGGFPKRNIVEPKTGVQQTNSLPSKQQYFHTVIVGAGLAGLSTARELVDSGINPATIIIVEVRDRVGGRVVNLPSKYKPGSFFEGGGTWISESQTEIKKLLQRYNIGTFEAYNQPVKTLKGVVPQEAQAYVEALNNLATDIPLARPWAATKAAEYDLQTLQKWVNDTVPESSPLARKELTDSPPTSAADRMSFLWYLWWLHSVGSYQQQVSLQGRGQALRIEGGAHSIALKMEQELQSKGVTIFYNTFVGRAEQSSSDTKEIMIPLSAQNLTLVTNNLVIAVGVGDRQGINLQPPISADHREFSQKWPSSTSVKAFLLFDKPFWRAPPFLVDIPTTLPDIVNTSDSNNKEIGMLHDLSPDLDKNPNGGGILMTLLDGGAGTNATGKDARESVFRQALRDMFGNNVPTPLEYQEQIWGPTQGTWTCFGYTTPNTLTTIATTGWRSTTGQAKNIFFVGADTADQWRGYMEGALRSAKRVLLEMGPPPPPTQPAGLMPNAPPQQSMQPPSMPTVGSPTTRVSDDAAAADDDDLNSSEIVGIVLGCLGALLLFGLMLVLCRKRKGKHGHSKGTAARDIAINEKTTPYNVEYQNVVSASPLAPPVAQPLYAPTYVQTETLHGPDEFYSFNNLMVDAYPASYSYLFYET